VHTFPRPTAQHLSVERKPAEGVCAECGARELADYRVVSEGGWWDVRKCQRCLASVRRERGPRFGSYTPLGLEIEATERRR
jgi:vanillate/4-hydroxybenzoate decarboxylase subunit D